MSDEIKDAIEQNATDGIASASGESGSMTKTSIKDQIEADKYLKAQQGVTGPTRGLIFTRLTPPGAV